ncbi:MAG TPA: hypothetical protein VLC92_00335 [Rhodocyclaceae bacterium]|nr:hypothetical protein [Rhodocyclaceae bacterium]
MEMMIESAHPTPELRRQFARVARNYVAAMDAFTNAIKGTEGESTEAQTQAVKSFANTNRRNAYNALIDAAIQLARAEGRA